MAYSLGEAVLGLRADKAALARDMRAAETSVQQSMQRIGGKLTSLGQGLTRGLTVLLLAAGGYSVKMASDLAEAANAVNVVFGEAADEVLAYGEGAAQAVGMSQAAFDQMAAQTGALLQNLGFDMRQAADETVNLTERASDMASIFNTDVDQAMGAIQSALKGEFNPLETYGVKLNAAAVEAKALAMGLADSASELTESAKAQAALALIYEQTDKIAGDFQRTSDGLANSTRILKAELADQAAALGELLLPAAQWAVDALRKLTAWFGKLSPQGRKIIVVVAAIAAAIGPALIIIGQVISAVGAISGVLSAVAGVLSGPVLLAIGAAVAAVALFAAAWRNNWGGIRDTLTALWAQIVPILQTLWAWLKEALPQAIETLRVWWQTVLLPALQQVWAWMQANLLPILQALGAWLAENIPLALQTLADYWQNVLQPALQAVWEWMQGVLFPFLGALADFLSAAFSLAVTALAGLWENVLLPALQVVGAYLADKLGPAFETLGNFLSETVWPILQQVGEFLGEVFLAALDGISEALEWLTDKLSEFADGLRNIELPEWLTPGSPTPWEIGLLGIADALRRVSRQGLPEFQAGLRLLPETPPGLEGSLGAGAGRQVVVQQTYNFRDTTLDEGQLANAMRRWEALYA